MHIYDSRAGFPSGILAAAAKLLPAQACLYAIEN
jgi:hypothetical protein